LYFAVWTAEGSLIKSTASGDIPDPIGPRLVPQGPDPLALEDARIRSRGDLREAYVYGHFGTVMLVGRSIAADRVELRRSAWLLGATGGGVLLVGLVGGWLLSVRAVRPITAITYVAQDISASNLSRRIDKAGTSSELGTLAAVLNDTFARLESAFNQQIRFTADASHELRTPLTVIHTNVQLALARQRSAEEYRAMFQSCARASDRMKGLLDSLLLLARADAGSLPMSLADCDLKRIVEDSAAMLMPLAATKNIAVDLQVQSAPLKADASRLGQVVTNLLTNAIRYNRDGGTIVVTVAVDADDNARLSIADTGIGIPVENQPQLFERFYRVDFSRARDDGGTGLGLAICKTIVEAHRGTITFTSEPGKGSTFTVRLPR
jgi:heavy metal sensor kinase